MPKLPFHTLQRLELPLAEMVSGRLGFVPDAFLPFRFQIRDTLPDEERDLVVILGKRRRSEGIERVAEHPGRVIVLFAPNDASIRPAYLGGKQELPPNVVVAYAVNNRLADRRAIAVPLGVRINKLRALHFVRQNSRPERGGLLYGNFALNNDFYRPQKDGIPHVRRRLVEQLRDTAWADLDIGSAHREDPTDLLRYYAQIATHKFVLSPPGNGVDCYRHWEVLYLGAIPVVQASTEMSPFAELPILFTDDYTELSEDHLLQRWEEMSSRSFEIERMQRSWYRHHFLQSVGRLDDPRFVCLTTEGSPSQSFLRSLRGDENDLMAPDRWNAPGALRLEPAEMGLRAVAEGDGRAVAELALRTLPSAPLTLTGHIRPETHGAPPLRIAVEERPEVIAEAMAGDGNGMQLRLGFVARSERTVLSIAAPLYESGTRWLLDDLSLQADL